MTKLEQLKFDYLTAKGEKEAYQSDEKCARKKVLEWAKRMKEIEKEIKQIEESESDKKLKESIDFIKNYCEGINYCSEECKFYCRIDEFNKTECLLRNNFPEYWGK